MKEFLKITFRPLIRRFGIDIVRSKKNGSPTYPSDFSEQSIRICNTVRPFTMTSPARLNALVEAVQYIIAKRIDGAMVECGVWRGGSAMAIALTLMELGVENREIFLYDTYSGMSRPGDVDISIGGLKAHDKFAKTKTSDDSSNWCWAALDEVKKNLFSTGYPKEKIHFIEGKVEDTLPKNAPTEIALLRLDTDWYQSTKQELVHLYPLLNEKGVLIVDDYGHWEGARRAVDEYVSENNIRILLNRIDYTGRIALKT